MQSQSEACDVYKPMLHVDTSGRCLCSHPVLLINNSSKIGTVIFIFKLLVFEVFVSVETFYSFIPATGPIFHNIISLNLRLRLEYTALKSQLYRTFLGTCLLEQIHQFSAYIFIFLTNYSDI